MADPRRLVVHGIFIAIALAALPPPASAQIDLSGEWNTIYNEDSAARGLGPELGDYTGIPINEAGRLNAESWDASILSRRERQCIPHIVTYALRGPATIRLSKDPPDPVTGQVTAWRMHGSYGRPRTIWIDGRPHPSPNAPHTWTGFSTGRWDGNTFIVTTTHIKTGGLQRNGVAHSDQDLVSKGRTLAQVKAARPSLDYDGRYGATTGPWTTEMFIEAMYRDVVASRGQEAGGRGK